MVTLRQPAYSNWLYLNQLSASVKRAQICHTLINEYMDGNYDTEVANLAKELEVVHYTKVVDILDGG